MTGEGGGCSTSRSLIPHLAEIRGQMWHRQERARWDQGWLPREKLGHNPVLPRAPARTCPCARGMNQLRLGAVPCPGEEEGEKP